jgi:CheY-like chemotaxis protein
VLETLEMLRATIPTTIAFDTALSSDAPIVLADSTQIHQILMNLGTNAWHAMERGGRLGVSLESCLIDAAAAQKDPRLRPGRYARLTVRDTGKGMDEATLQRVFEPFFTTKPLGQGTGLGLAMVHGIMDTHDGVLTLSSRLGVGTEFVLYFPEHAGRVVEPEGQAKPTPRGRGERILFVDDEETLVRLGSRILTQLGYETAVATDPEAALAMFASNPTGFDLVLTDLTMPKMTGPTLAAEIWKIRAGLPIILLTGYSASLTPERAATLGFRQLLFKPVGFQALGLAVHGALQTNPAPEGGPAH